MTERFRVAHLGQDLIVQYRDPERARQTVRLVAHRRGAPAEGGISYATALDDRGVGRADFRLPEDWDVAVVADDRERRYFKNLRPSREWSPRAAILTASAGSLVWVVSLIMAALLTVVGLDLEIVAHLEKMPTPGENGSSDLQDDTAAGTFRLQGAVLRAKRPFQGATVNAIVRGPNNNDSPFMAFEAGSPPRQPATDAKGAFRIDGIEVTDPESQRVEVSAQFHGPDGRVLLYGEKVIGVPNTDVHVLQTVAVSPLHLVALPLLLIGSFVIPLVGVASGWRYFASLSFAGLFTAAMLTELAFGMWFVRENLSEHQVLRLGFATVYNDSGVGGESNDWIFSLTSPPEIRPLEQGAYTGLGAPLWLMLLSVAGSGMLTVSLVTRGIRNSAGFGNLGQMQVRDEGIIRHQLSVLSAPASAVLSYQLLVAGDAAGNPLTVAIATLAGGAAVIKLLGWATTRLRDSKAVWAT